MHATRTWRYTDMVANACRGLSEGSRHQALGVRCWRPIGAQRIAHRCEVVSITASGSRDGHFGQ